MPHDKNGTLVEKGQKVTMEFTVAEVHTGDEYCNATLESVEPMFPGEHKTTVTVNTKQVSVLATLLLCMLACFGPALARAQATPLVTAVISSQGTDVIKQTTGFTAPKNAALARIDICNLDAANDHNQSVSGAIAAIIVQEQYSIYGSDVVNAVLAQLQQRDVFTRAQKAITAGANTAVLLTALFKTLTPFEASVIQAAPSIAQAVLPAVGDPRDLAALGQRILQDNTALTLGKKGSGNDCHTGLVVAMTASVKIDRVTVQ